MLPKPANQDGRTPAAPAIGADITQHHPSTQAAAGPAAAASEPFGRKFTRCFKQCQWVTFNLCMVYVFEYIISAGKSHQGVGRCGSGRVAGKGRGRWGSSRFTPTK